ncbi:MAG: VTT domain-containing protein [Paracoccaceae bacterium]
MFEALQHLLGTVSSRSAEMILLFLMPFLREDVAIVAGGLLVVEHRLPFSLALASLYAGIIASDFLLYGLGKLARRSARVRRLLLRPRLERIGERLSEHLAAAMIVARIVPGLIFPVYVGCGLLGVRIRVFAPITLMTGALYLPVLLWAVIRFGEQVLSQVGYWTWIAVMVALVAITVGWARNPPWAVLLRVGRSGFTGLVSQAKTAVQLPRMTHVGMPSLRGLASRIGFAERIPTKLFYLPLVVHWTWLSLRYRSLSLPTLANPLIEVGGLWGESKKVYLDMVAEGERRWLARYTTLTRGDDDAAEDGLRAVALAQQAGLGFPLVAKPDIGWQGYGVRRVPAEPELRAYVAAFPEGATLMLQEVIEWEGEAGVFYMRQPGEERGRVIGLTFRYFPHVVGDGVRTVRDLVLADQRASWKAGMHLGYQEKHRGVPAETLDHVPAAGEIVRLAFIGSIRVGGLYRDAQEHITPELTARFDAISRSMPEFYYGRYDVRFASVERLREGEGFRIIEINGAGSETISVWDPEKTLGQVYSGLFEHQRLMFEIGARNRARGFRPAGLPAVLRAAWRQRRLVDRYPPSG